MTFFESLKVALINMVAILKTSAKSTSLGLLKIMAFWNKVYDVTNKILPRDSNYIVDFVMWPKFGNCSISMREVIITSVLDLNRKTDFFWVSFFKFNNLELALGLRLVLGMALQFYICVAKRVKTKSQKVLEANFYFCKNYRRKTGRVKILNRVKVHHRI